MKYLKKHYLSKFEEYDDHEKVLEIEDDDLHAFISIHNTNLGPAVGGTRLFPYKSREDALVDVLRLSRGMTYKCAISGVSFGGGKGVIVGDPQSSNKDEILEKYARIIRKLDGKFFTGEDVGISESDVQKMLLISPYFIGRSTLAGDPSPYAALSTYWCIKVVAKNIFGSSSLEGIKIGIKGIGKVGSKLAELVGSEGAKLFIADTDKTKLTNLQNRIANISILNSDIIHQSKVDIYSPCAMGNEFTFQTITEVNSKAICGAANNQLNSDEVGDWFFTHNKIYAPDYIANAGGLINVVDELENDGYKKSRVIKRIKKVAASLKTILKISKEKKIPTNRIADSFAESIFRPSQSSKKFTLA